MINHRLFVELIIAFGLLAVTPSFAQQPAPADETPNVANSKPMTNTTIEEMKATQTGVEAVNAATGLAYTASTVESTTLQL